VASSWHLVHQTPLASGAHPVGCTRWRRDTETHSLFRKAELAAPPCTECSAGGSPWHGARLELPHGPCRGGVRLAWAGPAGLPRAGG
jgi:hypothetical protein